MKNNSKAYFLIIAAVIIWSLSGLLVKAVNVDPLWISLIRCLGGGIFLLRAEIGRGRVGKECRSRWSPYH